ncbi:MAG: carbon-nitrogen hydrolase family protein [Clostridiales bacterium]|jgi:predicted amidohydrolase|nr:carbon-nitrogen hydrolase family protein [Clostridiales bacterium]
MNNTVRVGACQTPEIIGNPSAALACMLRFAKEAEDKNVDLLLFPECFLSGYILDKTYIANYSYDFECRQFVAILKQLKHVKPVLVFGVSEKKAEKFFNSAVVVNAGELIGVYRKTHLLEPNESFFTPGNEYPIFSVNGVKYGINICYDAQFADSAKALAEQDARLLLLPAQNMLRRENAEKWKHKHNEIRSRRVKETGLWFISSDVTGIRPPGQFGEERIAYGPTLAMNPKAEIVAQVPLMTVGMITADIP